MSRPPLEPGSGIGARALLLPVTGLVLLLAAGCGGDGEAPGPADGPGEGDGAGPAPLIVTVHFTAPGGEGTVAVRRRVPDAPRGGAAGPADSLRAALGALVRGPRPEEAERGVNSFFSPASAGAIRSVELHGDRAVIDFTDVTGLLSGASSSAGSRALLAELNATVFEVGSVESVLYRMEGSCERFWNWLQRPCRVVRRPERGGGPGPEAAAGPRRPVG